MNIQHIPQIKHTDSEFLLLAGPCCEGEEK
jgi:hypothetical protein